jgi:hypothetical protein
MRVLDIGPIEMKMSVRRKEARGGDVVFLTMGSNGIATSGNVYGDRISTHKSGRECGHGIRTPDQATMKDGQL